MSLPLWDDIELPPDYTLVDINGLEPETLRTQYQAEALQLWVDETGESPMRDWSDDEGIFVVKDASGEIVGIHIMADVEDA